jgi:hypothetical protein
MKQEPVTSVQWNGRETVPMVSQVIAYSRQIEIQLAPEYNHALFLKLHPDAPLTEKESVDKSGDAELLNRVSEINGLENIALLVDTLRAEDAWVHIVSPSRIIIGVPSDRRQPPETTA